MKKYLRVLFGFAMVWHTCDAVNALEISGNTVVSGTYFLNENTTVLNNSLFSANNIQTINSLTITNYGQISGKINVCTNCMVEVRNTGIFDADVLLQPGAHFVQVISENDEITNLGLSSEYDVVVRDGNDLNFAEVVFAINVGIDIAATTPIIPRVIRTSAKVNANLLCIWSPLFCLST